ncbi:hypothetical protein ABVK25_000929 [Lepraria finkii]|uniref:Mob1/phocein n=1 Tax=Lepraria finkii TaxID=1340010 RepID=A0ABR4BPA7_9LECA
MASSFMRSLRSGFGRQNEAPNVNTNQQRANGSPNPSPTSHFTSMPPLNQSASSSSNMNSATETVGSSTEAQAPPDPIKYFFREQYVKLGVKGNFMPLAAQPTNVDLGEWLAHQTVEHYRLISIFVQLIQEVDTNTNKPICNAESCPRMTAGRHTYTWLDHNRTPIPVSAHQYISLVQRWMNGKVHDPKAFPTDPPNGNAATFASGNLSTPTGERPIPAGPTNVQTPTSILAGRQWPGKDAGFPESFVHDVRTCFRQIFRIYAHLYHSHWIDPFWHPSGPNNNQGLD